MLPPNISKQKCVPPFVCHDMWCRDLSKAKIITSYQLQYKVCRAEAIVQWVKGLPNVHKTLG